MKTATFNEDSRVKIPAIIHLERLGYEYISKDALIDEETNIFIDIFKKYCDKKGLDSAKELQKIKLFLDYDDLGKEFYHYLISNLIDFENFDNNFFNVVSELTFKKDEDEFRPDVTVLINGIPLIFIEVKKPNNLNGMNAEKERLIARYKNKNFKKFFNEIVFMIYSNNMEYVDQKDTLIGSFYVTASENPKFNYFREEDQNIYHKFNEITKERENFILKDNNLAIIKHSPEYKTNKSHLTPLNKFLSSLLNKNRLKFILKYSIAFVDKKEKQKHIMRYPQIFASFAIQKHLESGNKKGIIWHTQGSGKTALSFYNVKILNDYFARKGKVAKFYFIVDRLDLLKQAQKEFIARGLRVRTIQNKKDFIKEMSKNTAVSNNEGELEITVVNIQKFDSLEIPKPDYDIDLQRVYFIDEAHRSYNPKGSFLANLYSLDKNAVFIALTGTPLLKKEYKSRDIFGDYIHKYYYNLSIKDGYTLRLIREEIEASYKAKLKEILESIEIEKGIIKSHEITSRKNFVRPMLNYILDDLEKFRKLHSEKIGGMIVCDSSAQARALYNEFLAKRGDNALLMAAEPRLNRDKYKINTAALILHDEDTKTIREDKIQAFKDGKIDLLIVYNMLLTGFDAPILKKLYLTRVIKAHNLLQTLTRVNRPYKNFKYGYIVDFANIKEEFDKTNRLYWDELQNELGDEVENYSRLFKTSEEIEKELQEIEEYLFEFDVSNLEIFSQQIRGIEDIDKVREIVKTLTNLKELFNIAKLYGYEKITQNIDINKINIMLREVRNYLSLLIQKEAIDNDIGEFLNIALEDLFFEFNKTKEEELKLADELKEVLRKTREEFLRNFDKKDPEYVSLKEELERIFKNRNIFEADSESIKENIPILEEIYKKVKALNRANERLAKKYKNDKKYAKIHKTLKNKLSAKETEIQKRLLELKEKVDKMVLNREDVLDNEEYFKRDMAKYVAIEFKDFGLKAQDLLYISNIITREYICEYKAC